MGRFRSREASRNVFGLLYARSSSAQWAQAHSSRPVGSGAGGERSAPPEPVARHRRARLAHRQSRQEIFEMLHALRQQGLTYSEIAIRTGYKR